MGCIIEIQCIYIYSQQNTTKSRLKQKSLGLVSLTLLFPCGKTPLGDMKSKTNKKERRKENLISVITILELYFVVSLKIKDYFVSKTVSLRFFFSVYLNVICAMGRGVAHHVEDADCLLSIYAFLHKTIQNCIG